MAAGLVGAAISASASRGGLNASLPLATWVLGIESRKGPRDVDDHQAVAANATSDWRRLSSC